MLSINTNPSNVIVQKSLKNSTLNLNQAVERMSSGYKINHAADNAANYSIGTNMTTKLSSLKIAEDNAMEASNLITAASDSLNLISNNMSRIRMLVEQASNGSYGKSSLKSINAEINALADEIERIYSTTEYNGLKLFNPSKTSSSSGSGGVPVPPDTSTPPTNDGNLIKAVNKRDTSKMTALSSIDPYDALPDGTYSISTYNELCVLGYMTLCGLYSDNCEFVLGADIDLTDKDFAPIGVLNNSLIDSSAFHGTFDGNGYTISNVTINPTTMQNAGAGSMTGIIGFFGLASNAVIKNLSLENISVSGGADTLSVGGLIGTAVAPPEFSGMFPSSDIGSVLIENCYVEGSVNSEADNSGAGGIIGSSYVTDVKIVDTIANVDVTGYQSGGLGGYCHGLGYTWYTIDNCWSLGDVTTISASGAAGGLVVMNFCGNLSDISPTLSVSMKNSYSTGTVSGPSGATLGGFAGAIQTNTTAAISNCGYNAELNPDLDAYATAMDSDGNPVNITQISAMTSAELIAKYPLTPPQAKPMSLQSTETPMESMFNFQVGINGNNNSQISITTSFILFDLEKIRNAALVNKPNEILAEIDKDINLIAAKQTEYGAAQNRIETVIEEITTQYDGLLSSLSTIRDTDISKVSSQYIRNQILQNASSVLMTSSHNLQANMVL